MKDNVIIIPATENYFHELDVLLKSLHKYMSDTAVHLISIDGQADHYKDKYTFIEEVINEPMPDFGDNKEFRRIRTSRFRHAADIKNDFKTVCLLDADFCIFRSFHTLFRLADTGAIICSSNNTLYRYKQEHFKEYYIDIPYNTDLVVPSFSTVPLWINPRIHEPFLREVWTNKTGNDLTVPNLMVDKLDLRELLYFIPSQQVTNIHHSMLKRNIGAKGTTDGLYTESGEPVYMLHGHWGDKAYVDDLINPIIKNFGKDFPKDVEYAKNCITVLRREYAKHGF